MKALRIAAVTVFAATTALIIFYSTDRNEPAEATQTALAPSLLAVDGNLSAIDSDEDGLSDWEEVLWNTDPKNPDTDGDGITDGKESKDELKKLGSAGNKETPDESAPAPRTVSPRSSPEKTDATVAPAPASDQKTLALKAYGNSVARTFGSYAPKLRLAKESETFTALIDAPTATTFDALGKIADIYTDLSEALATIDVPAGYPDIAPGLSAPYEALATDIRGLAALKSEGKVTSARFKTYNETSLAAAKALLTLGARLKAEQVSFSPSEPGYVFTFEF